MSECKLRPRVEQGGSELLLSRDDAEMARYISRGGMSGINLMIARVVSNIARQRVRAGAMGQPGQGLILRG